MIRLIFIALTIGMLYSACQTKQGDEKRIEEIKDDGSVAGIIRNPVSADGTTDTVNVAKMTFQHTAYDFGEVEEGAVIEHTFEFENTGKVPLIISDARSTCGCTVPEWSEEPIAPGETSQIKVRFNTAGKLNAQQKPITIIANTYPSETVVHLKGSVRQKSS